MRAHGSPFLTCFLLFQPLAGQTPAKTPPAATPAPPSPPAPEDLASPPSKKSPSGLATKVLTPGTGRAHPRPQDRVKIHFSIWLADGKFLDSTFKNGEPANLFLARLMKGMSEGIQLMVAGEKRRLWLTEDLAYAGAKGRPSGSLVMDVELLDLEPPPTEAPVDVAGVPTDALLLPSGLAYRVLRPGSGKERAGSYGQVSVHYTGWTTDGKMFDSSVMRGSPSDFRLNQVIKGWTLGISLMAKGEKTRFWIPEKLAYRGEQGKPAGMLVFDIELISIDK